MHTQGPREPQHMCDSNQTLNLNKMHIARSQKPGEMIVIMGPMFSGKTQELKSRIDRNLYAKRSVLCISMDHRSPVLTTHSGSVLTSTNEPNYAYVQLEKPTLDPNVIQSMNAADIIALDELQFFDSTIVATCNQLVLAGKTIIAAGLNSDFNGNPFPTMSAILPHADVIVNIAAVCYICTLPALYSARIDTNNKPKAIIDEGGKDKYMAVCRRCFYAPKGI